MIFFGRAIVDPVVSILFQASTRVGFLKLKGTSVKPIILASFATVLLMAAAGCQRDAGSGETAVLEQNFQKSLSGATLVGHFTMGEEKELREEKYTIEKVSKISDGLWLFQVRIQYGSRDVTVPVPLNVKWAGDTPVITLTDFSIPGLGTYTARVLIYRDQYAGTWSAKNAGGQLFGRVVREAEPAAQTQE